MRRLARSRNQANQVRSSQDIRRHPLAPRIEGEEGREDRPLRKIESSSWPPKADEEGVKGRRLKELEDLARAL